MFTPHDLGLDKVSYSVSETLRITGLKRTQLYKYVGSGALRITKAGRKSLCLSVDIATFLSKLRDGE